MNIRNIITKAYSRLLRLYPSSFRDEFEEQMLLDFSDMAGDVRERGRIAFLIFCLHELVDFPANLLRAHWKEGDMNRIFHSQPVNFGLRGATGFAVTFFIVGILDELIHWKINSHSDAIMEFLFDIFHTAQGPQWVSILSFLTSILVTGLLFGIMLALLFTDRSKYFRTIIVGMLSWFLSYVGTVICIQAFNMNFYLGSRQASLLMRMMGALSVLFMALMFVVARSNKKWPYQALILGSFVYPLSLYFFIQLLFKVGWIEAPIMFISLVVLVIIYIGSVFLIAVKSEDNPKIPWMFLVFAVGYFLVPGITSWIYWQLFPAPAAFYTDPPNWQQTLLMAMRVGIFEIPLGIFVGVALGFQKKNAFMQLSTSG